MKKLDFPPVWLLGCLLATGLLWYLFPGLAFHFDGHRIVSLLMLALGLGIVLLAIREMGRAETPVEPRRDPNALVTSGVFGYSRNPIYLGGLIVVGAGIMFWGSYPAFLLLGVYFKVIENRFIKGEETVLREHFGEAFEQWATKTRRWL